MKRLSALLLLLVLVGCRDVRVRTYAAGITYAAGHGDRIAVIRTRSQLSRYGIVARDVRFPTEFCVALLMGPHRRSGFRQIVESIDAGLRHVRVVAFEQPPSNGGEPTRPYRTYTLWVIPNSAYRRGIQVVVVTPEDRQVAETVLP
ncbi:MAG: hypothetical protein HKL92_06725 [Candidatus Eremiobacteraeota bacterium]|nr:hypothetical protein [Candidatus Eremiobacteraeota bacterium]NNM93022.1 hypothetical protein [Candidatus Eremiobacteraeota bacterium]